jgi:hypothetical protein
LNSEKRYIDFIQEVLISVHENIHDLNERKTFADPEELSHIEGKLQAYREFIAILKSSADEFGLPKNEIGL